MYLVESKKRLTQFDVKNPYWRRLLACFEHYFVSGTNSSLFDCVVQARDKGISQPFKHKAVSRRLYLFLGHQHLQLGPYFIFGQLIACIYWRIGIKTEWVEGLSCKSNWSLLEIPGKHVYCLVSESFLQCLYSARERSMQDRNAGVQARTAFRNSQTRVHFYWTWT